MAGCGPTLPLRTALHLQTYSMGTSCSACTEGLPSVCVSLPFGSAVCRTAGQGAPYRREEECPLRGAWRDCYSQGDRNILRCAERSVGLVSDADIPDGSRVRLYLSVAAGYSNAAVEQYIFQKVSASLAVYQISGIMPIHPRKLLSNKGWLGA